MKKESITKLVKDILDWWEDHKNDEVPVGDDEWENQYENPIFVLEAQRLSAEIEANSISPKALRIEGLKLAEQVTEEWVNLLETERGWAVSRLEHGDDREPTYMANENETFFLSARDVMTQFPKRQQDDSPQP